MDRNLFIKHIFHKKTGPLYTHIHAHTNTLVKKTGTKDLMRIQFWVNCSRLPLGCYVR